MKKSLWILLVFVLALSAYVYHILSSTGFFRDIEEKHYGSIIEEFSIKGAEDIAISREDSFLIVSATDRRALKAGKEVIAGLYLIDLRNRPWQLELISGSFDKPFHPLGISLLRIDSGSYRIYAINDFPGSPSLEVFQFESGALSHLETLSDPLLVDPNDVVAISEDQLYITNDHGYTSKAGVFFENYLGLKVCTVVNYDYDQFKIVAEGIGYANGINYSDATSKVYVSSSRSFTIKEYSISSDGMLSLSRDIDAGSGVDNIEFDVAGNLYVACHPNLLAFTSYAALKSETSPSEIIRISLDENPEVESIYVEAGDMLSASSVAVPFGNLLFVGSVMDDKIIVLNSN